MTREALEALAARCEQATGPDAELSKDIHEGIGNCVHRETKYYCIEDGNDCDSGFTCVACGKDTYGFRIPDYTASVDAALTLVPEGWVTVRVERERAWEGVPDGWYIKTTLMEPHGRGFVEALALTEANSRTAAALRAHAAKEDK